MISFVFSSLWTCQRVSVLVEGVLIFLSIPSTWMNFSSNHHDLNFPLITAHTGNTLNSNCFIQNAGRSLVVLTGLGICWNQGLECDADENSTRSVAWTMVNMRIQHHRVTCYETLWPNDAAIPGGIQIQGKIWDGITPASTSSAVSPSPSELLRPFHPLPEREDITHEPKRCFCVISVWFILRD